MKNNPLYEYSISMSGNDDFIYFDEKQEQEKEIMTSRFIISEMLKASQGNVHTLHAILCLWAGMSLREASKVTQRSHEAVRLALKSIKNISPELYEILKKDKYIVESLIPYGSKFKWKITNKNKVTYISNLSEFCRKNKLDVSIIYNIFYKKKINKCEIEGYIIERSFKNIERWWTNEQNC